MREFRWQPAPRTLALRQQWQRLATGAPTPAAGAAAGAAAADAGAGVLDVMASAVDGAWPLAWRPSAGSALAALTVGLLAGAGAHLLALAT